MILNEPNYLKSQDLHLCKGCFPRHFPRQHYHHSSTCHLHSDLISALMKNSLPIANAQQTSPLPSPQQGNGTDSMEQHSSWYGKGKFKVLLLLLLAVGIWWVGLLYLLPHYLLNEKPVTWLPYSGGELNQSGCLSSVWMKVADSF